MSFSLNIPRYHSKDFQVLVLSMLPMAVLLNYLLITDYFSSFSHFFIGTLVCFIALAGGYICCAMISITLKERLPSEKDILKYMLISLGIFYLMSAAFISLMILIYDATGFLGYKYRDSHFTSCYICLLVINTFLTFLNEGIYQFEKYRNMVTETEQLKKEYMQSQLLGLKSQMNPHFLFNSLNTLSSLIQEDAEKAEDFLDHMSKVYRYLLRNREEQLVTLETELNFIESYYFLLCSRHCEGLQLDVEIPQDLYSEMIPPLTLQMIVENAVNQNTMSRSAPLYISIKAEDGWLVINNTIQTKINDTEDHTAVLENISNKYRLLCQQQLLVQEDKEDRIIKLPLLTTSYMTTV